MSRDMNKFLLKRNHGQHEHDNQMIRNAANWHDDHWSSQQIKNGVSFNLLYSSHWKQNSQIWNHPDHDFFLNILLWAIKFWSYYKRHDFVALGLTFQITKPNKTRTKIKTHPVNPRNGVTSSHRRLYQIFECTNVIHVEGRTTRVSKQHGTSEVSAAIVYLDSTKSWTLACRTLQYLAPGPGLVWIFSDNNNKSCSIHFYADDATMHFSTSFSRIQALQGMSSSYREATEPLAWFP